MEFLYRLYSNDYFGIGLFVVITVLAFSFLIILFFGKKDEKKRVKQELENANNEVNSENIAINTVEEPISTDISEPITLSTETEILDTKEEVVDEFERPESLVLDEIPVEEKTDVVESIEPAIDPFVSTNMVLNSEIISETPESELQNDFNQNINEDVYNIETLNEEETIDEVLSKYDNIQAEEPTEEFTIDDQIYETPIIEEPVEQNIFSENIESNINIDDEISNMNTENFVEEESEPIVPVKPAFELPKLNQNTSAINENIISSVVSNQVENNSDENTL